MTHVDWAISAYGRSVVRIDGNEVYCGLTSDMPPELATNVAAFQEIDQPTLLRMLSSQKDTTDTPS